MAQQTTEQKLEKSSEYLKLNMLYEEFFKKEENINIDNRCKKLNNPNGNHNDARELCSKVGEYIKITPKKMDDIPIFKDIMGMEDKVNVPPKTYKCTLQYDKKDHCPIVWPFSSEPDYFSCTSAYNPKDFLSTAEKCKAKENGGGSGSFWGIFLGSSSSGTSSNRSGTSIQAPARAATSEAKVPGNAKNSSPGGLPENKGVKGATGGAAAGNVSKGLSSSTSTVTSGGSTRPGAEASVRDNVLSRGGLLGQAVPTNPKGALSPPPKEGPGHSMNAVPPYTSDSGRGMQPALPADSPSTLESVPDNVDSKFYRNIIMGVAIIGTIFFLIYYNMSSRLKSRFPKRKRKKKIFEHNYYEEYEKELARYESENESLDSQSDRYYLNYQPEGDYYY
ncbi:PIR protein [Plasmodium vivax]|nr:PIR protein [Plasmodium vivax]